MLKVISTTQPPSFHFPTIWPIKTNPARIPANPAAAEPQVRFAAGISHKDVFPNGKPHDHDRHEYTDPIIRNGQRWYFP